MFEKIKQINEARKIAKMMEEEMEKRPLKVENSVVSISGNLKKAKIAEIKIEANEQNKSKIQDAIVDLVNRYMSESESQKQKIMVEKMGGMGGMMNALKNINQT